MANDALAVVTAADRPYFLSVLNLIGSIQCNSPDVKACFVYDLGLARWQIQVLKRVKKVEVRHIPEFVSHWRQCWSWKAWIWVNPPASRILYLDAGIEVLRSVQEISSIIDTSGYFVVSQNTPGGQHRVGDIMPRDYFAQFGLPETVQNNDVVGAGIIGFAKNSDFYHKVILPTYELVKQGYNLGWSRPELSRNRGLHYMSKPPVRDCPVFRHDQTVLNLEFYKNVPDPLIQPLAQYAEYRGPNMTKNQLLWHHRRQSSLPWLNHLEFGEAAFLLKLLISLAHAWRQIKRRVTGKQLP